MKTYINAWSNEFTHDDYPIGKIVVSETEPEQGNDGPRFYPVVNYRRVTGDHYRPYTAGSPAWRKAANRALADRAQANFARRH